MMKKTIMTITIIIALMFVLSACAQKAEPKEEPKGAYDNLEEKMQNTGDDLQDTAESDRLTTEKTETVKEDIETAEAPKDIGMDGTPVTQEELDQLKADLDSMDVEDVGGLEE